MADYPTTKLEKALARRGASSTARPAWQEWMGRHDTVPGSALQAPDVLQNFTGSWAAQYGLGASRQTTNAPESPATAQRQINRLGTPGMPEINFRPYDWGTTRHGKYGPSLLGHPISFEVVGPTLKSPFLFHQWILNSGGGFGVPDQLTLDTITWRSTNAVPELLPPSLVTLEQIYGISAIPEEGLYLIVSLTGHAGRLEDIGAGVPGAGGVGDGLIGSEPVLVPARQAIATLNSGAAQREKYEIFRVTDMDATTLYLDSSKRIRNFFDIPVGQIPVIRAITLFKPAAARLVAVSGSGNQGKEQTFAFVPPERALNADLMPPRDIWTEAAWATLDPWLNYAPGSTVGVIQDYPQANVLPIPRAVRQGQGRLQGIQGEGFVAFRPGYLQVLLDAATTYDSINDFGRVVHIRNITRFHNGIWATATLEGGSRVGDPDLDRLLGCWEIVRTDTGIGLNGENGYLLRMVTQVDPLTGVPFYGSTEFMHLAQTGLVPGMSVKFQWTLHEPISTLWTTGHPQPEKLDSARLTHLIDPDWVRPTGKNIDLTDVLASPARPDRAIFNTGSSGKGADETNEDPGSLMDLGFRVVLFPAKPSGLDPARLIADFDNPITSNEMVLDPGLTNEKQFIEVDYSAGLVHLSHPPVAGSGCQLAPDTAILTNASNPRGEMVFFASFVPFSQEPGQRSPATRVTGGQSMDRVDSVCGDDLEATDLFGARLHWPAATGQTITSGTGREIKLAVQLDAIDLPPTGFVEVVFGDDVPVGTAVWVDGLDRRISTFGYTEVLYSDPGNGGNTTLRGCFGGGVNGSAISTTVLVVLSVVLRRDIVTPNLVDGTHGTDFQADTTYGYNKRPMALRFKRASMVPEPDGSMTVDTRDPLTLAHQELFSELFSSWVIRGGEMTTLLPAVGSTLAFSELTVVIAGIRTVLPAQSIIVPVVGVPTPTYVYIDGTIPSCPVYAVGTALPLPDGTFPPVSSDHVLLGQYEFLGANVTTWTDLRQPLTDIDKRLDITVGRALGHDQPGTAHFETLAEAVEYVALTMNPTAGSWGKYRRIKVVGPTLEDNAKLPIRPQVQGLIIEGAARRHDGVNVTDEAEVVWRGRDAPALFDLSGCSGIVIRDLVFRYDDNTSISVVPRERCLFTCDYRIDGLILADAHFENIRLHGPAHGFLYVNDDIDPNTGFDRVTFRNCAAKELTDFAIWCDNTVLPATHLIIDNCHFEVRKSTDVPGPDLVLGEHSIIQHAGGAEHRVIKDTFLTGGYIGVYLGGNRHTLQRVEITNTDNKAVDIVGHHALLEAVYARFVYTVVLPGRIGIHVRVPCPFFRMMGCEVILDGGGVGGDYALYVDGNVTDSKVALFYNEFFAQVRTGPETVVEGNRILDELLVGTGSRVHANWIIDNVGGAGNLEAGTDCVLTDNVVDGLFDTNAAATPCNLSNNWFRGTGGDNFFSAFTTCSGDIFDGRVIITNDGRFTGCQFKGSIVNDAPTAAAKNQFQGCFIAFDVSVDILAEDTLFQNCRFDIARVNQIIGFDGVRNSFVGNCLVGSLTLYLHDTAFAVRTGLVVQGNIFQKGVDIFCGLTVFGNYCTIEGNLIEGVEAVLGVTNGIYIAGPGGAGPGSHNAILGNVIGDAGNTNGLGANITESVISGNRVFGSLDTAVLTTNTIIQGNITGEKWVSVASTMEILGTDLTCMGNVAAGPVTFGATTSVFSGNRVDGNAVFSGQYSLFEGNYIGGGLDYTAPDSDLKSNVIGTIARVASGLAGGQQNIVGNTFKDDLIILAADALWNSTITGNYIMGQANLASGGGVQSLVDCTFSDNYVNSTFDVPGAVRTVFSGNRFMASVNLTGGTQIVVQGNWVGTNVGNANLDLRGCDDYTCMGNYITGDLLIDATAPQTNCGIVMGNRANLIGDGGGGAMPTNFQVTVGNKVANGAGTVYGAAPATASQNTHNVRDDV